MYIAFRPFFLPFPGYTRQCTWVKKWDFLALKGNRKRWEYLNDIGRNRLVRATTWRKSERRAISQSKVIGGKRRPPTPRLHTDGHGRRDLYSLTRAVPPLVEVESTDIPNNRNPNPQSQVQRYPNIHEIISVAPKI